MSMSMSLSLNLLTVSGIQGAGWRDQRALEWTSIWMTKAKGPSKEVMPPANDPAVTSTSEHFYSQFEGAKRNEWVLYQPPSRSIRHTIHSHIEDSLSVTVTPFESAFFIKPINSPSPVTGGSTTTLHGPAQLTQHRLSADMNTLSSFSRRNA